MATEVRMIVEDGVAVITLDGPDTLNAFSSGTAAQLSAAYAACDADDDVRVVVLTGAGRAFCSGADLSEATASFAPPGEEFSASPIQPPAWQVRKLVIAAVNGHAIGIGLTTALQCDLVLVAQDAKLAIPQVRFGMLGDGQSHFTLRRYGQQLAADLLLTGRTISGREAAERGLAARALPAGQVLEAAMEISREVAVRASPASIALSKQLLWADLDADEVAVRETAAHRRLMAHPDVAEASAAWREKRAPQWRLRVSDL